MQYFYLLIRLPFDYSCRDVFSLFLRYKKVKIIKVKFEFLNFFKGRKLMLISILGKIIWD